MTINEKQIETIELVLWAIRSDLQQGNARDALKLCSLGIGLVDGSVSAAEVDKSVWRIAGLPA